MSQDELSSQPLQTQSLQLRQFDLPSAPHAEVGFLSLLIAGRITDAVLMLERADFAEERHALIYDAVFARWHENQPLAPALLVEDLSAAGQLALVGGAGYLEMLGVKGTAFPSDPDRALDEFAATIRDKAAASQLMRACAHVLEQGAVGNTKTVALLDAASKQFEAAQSRLNVRENVSLTDANSLRRRFGEQRWLWRDYIPIGHVTGLLAQQGQGKSNVALDWCHRLALGHAMPDEQEPGITWSDHDRILYLDAEGFLQGILDRLAAWGTPDAPFLWPSGCDEKQWALNTVTGWNEFEAIISAYRPRLVVVDSLSGANTLEEKDNDQMKGLMQNFVGLAKRFDLALVLVHHLRKAGLGEPSWPVALDRSRGASVVTQLCRVVHAVGTPDATRSDVRRFQCIKSNLGPFPAPLGFEILESGLAWGDAPELPSATPLLDDAIDFLRAEIGSGRRPSAEVLESGQQQGLSEKTLRRAFKDMHGKARKEVGAGGRWFWALS